MVAGGWKGERMQPDDRAMVDEGGWQLEISCPQCGGAGIWDLLSDLERCRFCDSLLWWPKERATRDFLVVTNRIAGEDALTDAIATSEAMARQRQFLPRESGRREDAPLDLFSGFAPGPGLHEIKNMIQPGIRVRQCHTIYAPYNLCSLLLGFMVLGRAPRTARKVFQPLFFTHDEITPAYLPPWDFRDRGLKLSRQIMQPLGPELLAAHGFLPPQPQQSEDEALLAPWRGRRDLLRGELELLHHTAVLVSRRDWVVYRPYVYVQAEIAGTCRWLLLDGQFGTVAACPDDAEVERVRGGQWAGLGPEMVARRRLRIIPARCPECGADVPAGSRSEILICENCTRLWRPSPTGLERVRYGVVAEAPWPAGTGGGTGGTVYLPFWRCEGCLRHQGRSYRDFAALLAAMQAGGALSVEEEAASAVWWVPAFDAWPYRGYTEWAFAFGRQLSAADPPPVYDQLAFSGFDPQHDHVCGPVIRPEMVRSLFPSVLPGFAPEPDQRRLNPLLLQRGLGEGTTVERLSLVFVPAPVRDEGAAGEKIVGPTGRVAWRPLQTGQWPPGLRRTIRGHRSERRQ